MFVRQNDVKLAYAYHFPFSVDYEGALDEMGQK